MSMKSGKGIIEGLSEHEKDVIGLIGWGASAKEAGTILEISVETVRTHLRNAKRKTGLQKFNEIGALMFVEVYKIPLKDDRFGRIRKLLSGIVLILFVFMADMSNTEAVRVQAGGRSVFARGRRAGRRSDGLCGFVEEELNLLV